MTHLEQTLNKEDQQLKRGLGISFVLHIALLCFFTVKAVFFTQEPIDFSQAVRVDIVGLPEKVEPTTLPPPAQEEAKPALPEKEKPQEKPPEKPVVKPLEKVAEKKPTPVEPLKQPAHKAEDAVNLEKVKSKQQSALEKLKAMAALEKIKQEAEKTKNTPGQGKSETGAQKIKGNILSPGTSLTGLSKLQHDSYAADLDRHIKDNWSLPEWLAKRDFKAQARVFIDSRGNILDRKIVKSSGNPSYDEEVLATIDRSAPFPAPPEKFVAIVSVDGILIGFPE